MVGSLLVVLQAAAQTAPSEELKTAFYFVILVLIGAVLFLWLLYSRFSRPP